MTLGSYMKNLFSYIWRSFVLTLLYMALGSPLVLILYLLLTIMDIEALVLYLVVICAAVIFICQLHGWYAEKPRESGKKDPL